MKQTIDETDLKEAKKFPRPPLKGNDFIRPIRDQAALAGEAKEQDAGQIIAYTLHVLAREFYIYSILAPERATLCVARWSKRQPWRIAYVKSRGWQPVQPETVEGVNAWYAAARFARPSGWNGTSRVIRI